MSLPIASRRSPHASLHPDDDIEAPWEPEFASAPPLSTERASTPAHTPLIEAEDRAEVDLSRIHPDLLPPEPPLRTDSAPAPVGSPATDIPAHRCGSSAAHRGPDSAGIADNVAPNTQALFALLTKGDPWDPNPHEEWSPETPQDHRNIGYSDEIDDSGPSSDIPEDPADQGLEDFEGWLDAHDDSSMRDQNRGSGDVDAWLEDLDALSWDIDADLEADAGFDPFETEETAYERLDDYSARLVMGMPALTLSRRSILKRRFRSLLEEFPYASSFSAIAALVENGTPLETIEEAGQLKIEWRDSPSLWLRRVFDKMTRAWTVASHPSQRNAMTWRLAVHLVEESAPGEARASLSELWMPDWAGLALDIGAVRGRIPPRYSFYAAYLAERENPATRYDPDHWFYEEPCDDERRSSLSITDSTRTEHWRFRPHGANTPSGALAVQSLKKRIEDAARRTENEDE